MWAFFGAAAGKTNAKSHFTSFLKLSLPRKRESIFSLLDARLRGHDSD
jgi:hypothetical protein